MSEYRGIDLIQDPDKISWTPRGGFTIGRPFRGSQTQIQKAQVAALAARDAFDLNPGVEGALWEIVIYFGADENQPADVPISDTWELDGNTLEKELWELPWVRAEFDSITDDRTGNPTGDPRLASAACINWIRRNIEAFIRGESKTTSLDPAEIDLTYANLISYGFSYGFHKDALIELVRLYGRGVKAFPVSQFVLRRTRVLAKNYDRGNLTDIYDDIFKRRTTSSLESSEAIPGDIRFIMPQGEWVKQTPDMLQTSATKWTLKEEWWHADKWEKEIYGDLV